VVPQKGSAFVGEIGIVTPMDTSTQHELVTDTSTKLFMPASLDAYLRAIADEQDRPKSRVIRTALREYVERHRAEAVTTD
jgi:hypothetical protein